MVEHFVPFFICALTLMMCAAEGRERHKRIILGIKLRSLDDYDVRFVVSLRNAWGCSGSIEHEFDKCATSEACTGSLVHPSLVLTACQCGYWADSNLGERKAEGIFYRTYKSYHPLYNQMIVRAGTAENDITDDRIPGVQRRHIMSFLTHTLCNSQLLEFDELQRIIYDVALVKVCEPFKITDDVKLAERLSPPELTLQFTRVVRGGKICLWTGFGNFMEDTITGSNLPSKFLRYMFRSITCTRNCVRTVGACAVCSANIEFPRGSAAGMGDSGAPVMCENLLFAVHSFSEYERGVNITEHVAVPLHCFADYLEPGHLLGLLKLTDSARFHMEGTPYGSIAWGYGKPVHRRMAHLRKKSFSQYHSSQPPCIPNSLTMVFLYLLPIIWESLQMYSKYGHGL